MPFSWKKENNNSHSKKKITRVSRFVADIRSSSKHGESLVVQTGFPTSLIDLIVKNRDRLNKKKTRKNSGNEIVACCSEIEVGQDGPSIPLAPFILNAINNLFGEDKDEDDSDESSKENLILNEDRGVDVSSTNRFYKIFIMMSVVLILALATKRLVIGITLWAFLLFFLEFCCNYLISLLKSCINGCKGFMVSIHLGKDKNLIGVEERVVNNFVGFREEFDDLIKEKRIKEIDSELGKHDRLCELLDCERKREIEEDGEDNAVENVVLGRPRRTRSAKLRAAQFKKFMVKKFGSESKKKRKDKEGELDSSTLENEKLLEGDIREEDAGEDNDYDNENEDVDEQEVKKVKAAQFKKFMVKKFGAESKKKGKSKERELNSNTLENENVVERDIWEEEDNEKDDEQELKKVDRPDSKDLSDVHREVGFQEGLGRKVIWSSRNLVPVLVILSGLVCGRALALGLSVAWLVLRNLHKVVKIYLKRLKD